LDGPLFRSTVRNTGIPQRLAQSDAYLMIERRSRKAEKPGIFWLPH
jgi:hypothetical protein